MNYAVKSSYGDRDPRSTCASLLVRSLGPEYRASPSEVANVLGRFGEVRMVTPLPVLGQFTARFYDIRAAQKACTAGRVECGSETLAIEFKLDDDEGAEPIQQGYSAGGYPPQQPPVSQAEVQYKLGLLRAALGKA
jgi:hypothetical protein